jgi:hypothetical protein
MYNLSLRTILLSRNNGNMVEKYAKIRMIFWRNMLK